MTNDGNSLKDSVLVQLNEDETGPEEGTVGPDPEQWANRGESEDTGFVPADGDGEVKGPDPDEWGPEARAERGATNPADE